MNIHVHIERLVLDDIPVDPSQRPALEAAVRDELVRQLEGAGVAPGLLTGGTRHSVPAGAIALTNAMDATQMGHQIAQAVYGGIRA